MNYFETNYSAVRLPIAMNGTPGLRNAQLGAIHNIAGHFTLSSDDALVVMPTGSGKTAVQMLAAYLLRARRVLVITPNRLVRHQIMEEYQNLLTLKKAGVLGLEVPTPNVFEVEEKITSAAQWQGRGVKPGQGKFASRSGASRERAQPRRVAGVVAPQHQNAVGA